MCVCFVSICVCVFCVCIMVVRVCFVCDWNVLRFSIMKMAA